MKKRKAKSWRKFLLLLLFLILVGVGLFFLPKEVFHFGFTVKRITCVEESKSGEVFPCNPERLKIFEQFYDKNIFFLKSAEVAKLVQESDYQILDVKLKKKLPQTLMVKISSRQRQVCLSLDEKQFFLSDETGVILEGPLRENQCSHFPLIIMPTLWELKEGRSFNNYPALQKALILPKILQNFFINFEKIIIEEVGDLKLILPDKTVVYFSGEKDLKSQVASLQLILKQAKMEAPFLENEEGKIITQIDLRFEKPVLKFR